MLCTTPKSGGTALWEIYASDMSMNAVWRGAAFQGIFGLGWKDTDRNETTVLESMGVDQFTFCLGQGKKTPGTLHFNTILPDRPQVRGIQDPPWRTHLRPLPSGLCTVVIWA